MQVVRRNVDGGVVTSVDKCGTCLSGDLILCGSSDDETR